MHVIVTGGTAVIVHIGEERVLNQEDILLILDKASAIVSKHTRRFLRNAQNRGSVTVLGAPDEMKSYVVTIEKGVLGIYASPISSITLFKRAARQGCSL